MTEHLKTCEQTCRNYTGHTPHCPDKEHPSGDDQKEYLHLKWGTLKRWSFFTEKTMAALDVYNEAGSQNISAMMQRDNEAQKEALCAIIDALDADTVYLDWHRVDVSKEDAKEYVMGYDK